MMDLGHEKPDETNEGIDIEEPITTNEKSDKEPIVERLENIIDNDDDKEVAEPVVESLENHSDNENIIDTDGEKERQPGQPQAIESDKYEALLRLFGGLAELMQQNLREQVETRARQEETFARMERWEETTSHSLRDMTKRLDSLDSRVYFLGKNVHPVHHPPHPTHATASTTTATATHASAPSSLVLPMPPTVFAPSHGQSSISPKAHARVPMSSNSNASIPTTTTATTSRGTTTAAVPKAVHPSSPPLPTISGALKPQQQQHAVEMIMEERASKESGESFHGGSPVAVHHDEVPALPSASSSPGSLGLGNQLITPPTVGKALMLVPANTCGVDVPIEPVCSLYSILF
jgi:hypothetical protein